MDGNSKHAHMTYWLLNGTYLSSGDKLQTSISDLCNRKRARWCWPDADVATEAGFVGVYAATMLMAQNEYVDDGILFEYSYVVVVGSGGSGK